MNPPSRKSETSSKTESAPGSSGVLYKVFMNCPRILERLWKIYNVLWSKRECTSTVEICRGRVNASNIEQLRTILFLTVLSARPSSRLLPIMSLDLANAYGSIPPELASDNPRLEHLFTISLYLQHQCLDAGGFSKVLLFFNGSFQSESDTQIPSVSQKQALHWHPAGHRSMSMFQCGQP